MKKFNNNKLKIILSNYCLDIFSICSFPSNSSFYKKKLLLTLNNIKSYTPLNFGRFNKIYILDIISNHIIFYPTPICLTYAWSFGSLAGVCLIIQMISGIFLSMFYTADKIYSFQWGIYVFYSYLFAYL